MLKIHAASPTEVKSSIVFYLNSRVSQYRNMARIAKSKTTQKMYQAKADALEVEADYLKKVEIVE